MSERIEFIWVNVEQYSVDVLALLHSFFPDINFKLVFPESREDSIAEARAAGFFAQVNYDLSSGSAEVILRGQQGGGDSKYCFTCANAEDFKWEFGRFLYVTLRELTGRELPWGNLNGVRPTKPAFQGIDQEQSEEEILDFYKGRHFVSDRKAKLAMDIAGRELEILRQISHPEAATAADPHGYNGGYSLYVGIPFCPTTCLYCSFTSYPTAMFRKETDNYVDCVIREIRETALLMKGQILDSVYVGGGTPTALSAEQLDRLIAAMKESFDFATVKEFTVEAGRADSITEEKLKVLYRNGVSRISINPQTFCQQTLDIIGRKASVEQVLAVYPMAREIGFDNINMDIILGLPGEGTEEVAKTIERIVELAPDSLTVHSLAIKRASKLYQWIQTNGVQALKNTDETMEIARRGAEQLGMEPYYLYRQKNMSGNFENVGYALPGKFGLYNILIMEEVQTIVACGAGVVTKRVYPDGRMERIDNVKDVLLYIRQIDEMIERKRQLFVE